MSEWFAQHGDHLDLSLHPGQWNAWSSDRRFVVVLAGAQSGKTCFGPVWLYREIQRCGPGDYMVVTPTYPLLEMKALPEFLRLFQERLRLGKYVASPSRRFTFSREGIRRTFGDAAGPTRVLFGCATEPESLESATIRGVWCDEAGQRRFRQSAWEAILRRLALSQGRALLTTTPYDMGWLKKRFYDAWKAGDPEIDVIQFSSIMNPAFSAAEFERARRDLPEWKFDLFYRGVFTRPAGLIYESFDEERDVMPRRDVPAHWERFLGVDFGGVHTAAVFVARDPATGRLWVYREYLAGGRTAKEHVRALLDGEPGVPFAVGGAPSEDQWRSEFGDAGLPIAAPEFSSVEVGLDRVFGAHAQRRIVVFDDLERYLEEKLNYSRALDDTGAPTPEIERKSTFHLMDAERYIVGYLTSERDVATDDALHRAWRQQGA